MSSIFGGGSSGGSSLIPPGTEWISSYYGAILQQVQSGQSPYAFIERIVFGLYHPDVPPAFAVQLWALFGVFIFAAVVIVLGLSLRLAQGRLWFFTRLDRTVILPNTATLYGLCALVYQGLGIVLILLSIDVSKGADQQPYYQGLRRAWFGALWLGIYCETWSCLCSWYVRSRGAFYKQSHLRTAFALVLPLVLPLVAWIPPAYLFTRASQKYNRSFRISEDINAQLALWEAAFKPGDGFDVTKLATLFQPGAELGGALTDASKTARIGYGYCAGVLLLTFVIYLLAISLEVSHLSSTVSQLRAQARQAAFARSPARRAEDKPPAAAGGPLPAHLLAQLEEEQLGRGGDGQHPWTLLAWVRRNRLYTAACIATLLLVNAALDLWQAVTPLDLRYPSGQFQVETLVSCWLNGLLSTLVSLLLLFRSLDATTSPFLSLLRTHLPFLPFPPSVTLSHASRSLITTEPPRFAAAFAAGAPGMVPLVERTATRSMPDAEGAGGVQVALSESDRTSVWEEETKGEQQWGRASGSTGRDRERDRAESGPRAL
ncbi:hypothetical protein JCM10450v2_003065 [Rhodotorula kratochvilovae]